jgi:hypothetical protein
MLRVLTGQKTIWLGPKTVFLQSSADVIAQMKNDLKGTVWQDSFRKVSLPVTAIKLHPPKVFNELAKFLRRPNFSE